MMRIKDTLGRIWALFSIIAGCAIPFSCPDPVGRVPVPFTTDAGTIALWHLNETTGQDVMDSSGNGYTLCLGNNGTVETADPAWDAAGRFSGCLSFNAANSELAYGGHLAGPISLDANTVSIELWYRTTVKSGYIFNAGSINCTLSWNGNPYLVFSVGDGTTWHDCTITDAAVLDEIADGAWHYLAGTYDGTTIRLFVDGQVRASITRTCDLADPWNLCIGGRNSNTFVTGRIDEVRFSNVARSAEEIAAHYNQN